MKNNNDEEEFLELYHTSPEEIENVHDEGRFGSGLFFSYKPYYMGNNNLLYKYNKTKKKEILEARNVRNQDEKVLKPYVDRIMKMTGLDEEESKDILSENIHLGQYKNKLEDIVNYNQFVSDSEREKLMKKYKKLENADIGDIEYDIQSFIGQIAKKLGYRGVALQDEQGTSYLIDMLGRHGDLERIE